MKATWMRAILQLQKCLANHMLPYKREVLGKPSLMGWGAAAGRPWSTAAIAPPSTTALPFWQQAPPDVLLHEVLEIVCSTGFEMGKYGCISFQL